MLVTGFLNHHGFSFSFHNSRNLRRWIMMISVPGVFSTTQRHSSHWNWKWTEFRSYLRRFLNLRWVVPVRRRSKIVLFNDELMLCDREETHSKIEPAHHTSYMGFELRQTPLSILRRVSWKQVGVGSPIRWRQAEHFDHAR